MIFFNWTLTETWTAFSLPQNISQNAMIWCQLSVRVTIKIIILFTSKISCNWSISYRTLKIVCDWSISYRTLKIACERSISYRPVAENLGFCIRATVGNCLLIHSLNCLKKLINIPVGVGKNFKSVGDTEFLKFWIQLKIEVECLGNGKSNENFARN